MFQFQFKWSSCWRISAKVSTAFWKNLYTLPPRVQLEIKSGLWTLLQKQTLLGLCLHRRMLLLVGLTLLTCFLQFSRIYYTSSISIFTLEVSLGMTYVFYSMGDGIHVYNSLRGRLYLLRNHDILLYTWYTITYVLGESGQKDMFLKVRTSIFILFKSSIQ